MADILSMIQKHVATMHWVERLCYLLDRGWHPDDTGGPAWWSPHDGACYRDQDAVMLEMLREFDGHHTTLIERDGDNNKVLG